MESIDKLNGRLPDAESARTPPDTDCTEAQSAHSRFKLLVIGRADSPHTRSWIAPLAERGHQVFMIHVGPRPSVSAWPEAQFIDLPATCNRRWLRYPVWVLRTRRLVRAFRPHVMHAHCLDISGWVAAATAFRPLVVTVWGSDVLLHPQRSRAARLLARWVLRRADIVIASSQHLVDRAVDLSGRRDNTRVIPWGVDCRVFTPDGDRTSTLQNLGISPGSPVILSPRGFHQVYDPDTILEAMRLVVDRIPGAVLIMLDFQSDPVRRKHVTRRVRALELGENVRVHPAIQHAREMAGLLRASSLVISHAHTDSFAQTLLEAMASATPVVVSDLPAYRGWIEDGVTGATVPIGNPVATANAVLSILESDDTRLEMGVRARRLVCRHASLEQRIERSVELYSELTGRRKTTGSC